VSETPKKFSGESGKSKVDLFSGEHTTSLIVGFLFLIVLILFVCLLIWVNIIDNSVIVTGFFSLLSLLGGFFAGAQMNKK